MSNKPAARQMKGRKKHQLANEFSSTSTATTKDCHIGELMEEEEATAVEHDDEVAAAEDAQAWEEREDGDHETEGVSAKQRLVEDLAKLFCVQQLRHHSVTSHFMPQPAFIYQHVDLQMLSKCLPGFVKSHLTKTGRYLPETFILRVNYLRRRRALGDDSPLKRAMEVTMKNCKTNAGV